MVACANSVPLAPAGREAPQSPKALQAGAGATGIAVVAAVFQQWLRAGEQAAFAASDQPQPPIVEHRCRRDGQGLIQEGAVAEHGAAGHLVAQRQLPEGGLVASNAVPLPEALGQLHPVCVDEQGIGMD